MSDNRTGLDPVESAVIDALDALGVGPDAPHRKTTQVIGEVNARHGYAPDDVYARILALARPWLTPLRLIDFHGNYGGRSYQAADARYSEIRLTTLGVAAVRAAAGGGPALPVGLVMGDSYKGGSRPPHSAERMVQALRLVSNGADDQTVVHQLGRPEFPDGCEVEGDLESLWRGESVRLTLTAEVTEVDGGSLKITRLPPGTSEEELCQRLQHAREVAQIVDVEDHSTGVETNVLVRISKGVDAEAVREVILRTWGAYRYMNCSYGTPLAELLRGWVEQVDGELEGLSYITEA